MKNYHPIALAVLAIASLGCTSRAQTNSAQLTSVLKQMDAASQRFKNAQADFRWDYYEKIVRDTTTQTGIIYFQRTVSSTDMGAVVLGPDPKNPKAKSVVQKVIQFKAGDVQIFDPGFDQITMLHEAANKSDVEQFLTLGYGGSGSDLAKAWNVTDLGPETIADDGHAVVTEKLDLIGKDDASRKNFSHVTIWVDPLRAVSLKQVFYTPSGNIRTAVYSHIRINGGIDKSKFEIKRDKNTTVVNH